MKSVNYLNKVLLLSLITLPLTSSDAFAMSRVLPATSREVQELGGRIGGVEAGLSEGFAVLQKGLDKITESTANRALTQVATTAALHEGVERTLSSRIWSHIANGCSRLWNGVSQAREPIAHGLSYASDQLRQHPWRSAGVGLACAATVPAGYGLYRAYRWARPATTEPTTQATSHQDGQSSTQPAQSTSRVKAALEKAKNATTSAAKWCWNHKKITVPATMAATVAAAALIRPELAMALASNAWNLPVGSMVSNGWGHAKNGLARSWNWISQHKAPVGIGAATGATALLGGGIYMHTQNGAEQPAAQPEEQLSPEQQVAEYQLKEAVARVVRGVQNEVLTAVDFVHPERAAQARRDLPQQFPNLDQLLEQVAQPWAQIVLAEIYGNGDNSLAQSYALFKAVIDMVENNEPTAEQVEQLGQLTAAINQSTETILNVLGLTQQ